jgi:hypothetical protein
MWDYYPNMDRRHVCSLAPPQPPTSIDTESLSPSPSSPPCRSLYRRPDLHSLRPASPTMDHPTLPIFCRFLFVGALGGSPEHRSDDSAAQGHHSGTADTCERTRRRRFGAERAKKAVLAILIALLHARLHVLHSLPTTQSHALYYPFFPLATLASDPGCSPHSSAGTQAHPVKCTAHT